MPQIASSQSLENGVAVTFAGVDPGQLARMVDAFFQSEGYKLEAGAPGNAAYGIGSNVMRVLFGAFAKRYSFEVKVLGDGSQSTVELKKGMSGAMGGVIGHRKMTKETERICHNLQAYLSAQPGGATAPAAAAAVPPRPPADAPPPAQA